MLFIVLVRQSSIGENAFRKGLYTMSKRGSHSERMDYLYVYARFEQVCPDYLFMYFNVDFENSSYSDQFESLRIVSDRESVELLTNILQSSLSLRQRCAAAELIVHLTVIDQVSASDMQNLLTAAIDDVQSQQIVGSRDFSYKPDEKLRSLLICLMVTESKPMKSGGTIDVINETLYMASPAAVFQTKN
jgi:hypothetical protein